MAIPEAVHLLDRELREIFGPRLQSLVVYGVLPNQHAKRGGHAHGRGHAESPSRTMAVIEGMTHRDLSACAGRVDEWHARGLATPLLVAAHEFDQLLAVFPLEFGAILADHLIVSGVNPFLESKVDPADIRRACEVQARSHLLHLREGYLETRGRADALSDLIVQSAAAFAALLASVARLEGQRPADAAAAARHTERTLGVTGGAIADIVELTHVHELPSGDAERLFAPYLDAVERLVKYVDGWSGR